MASNGLKILFTQRLWIIKNVAVCKNIRQQKELN